MGQLNKAPLSNQLKGYGSGWKSEKQRFRACIWEQFSVEVRLHF